MKRNILLLSLSQASLITSTSLILTASPLVGGILAPDKMLATLPFSLLFLTVMTTTIPASLFMGKLGRRLGFMTSALFGLTGALLATIAIVRCSFALFCVGTVLIGVFNAFGQYYRFAAAESAPEGFRSRAISYVLAGGVISAFLGPNLARWSRQILSVEFAGSFASLVVLYLFAFGIAGLLRIPRPTPVEHDQGGRSLFDIARQPAYIVAVLNALVGYGVMNIIMIATPLAMHFHAHSFASVAFVIQWHIFGMFAPSFFTGHLIRRFGIANVIMLGIILLALCVGVNVAGVSKAHFWAALLSLGLGWNFVFIGSTTLLTETYSVAEKAKAQGLNDFIVFGTVTLTSFSSGAVQYSMGWNTVNLVAVPFLVLIFFANLWLRRVNPAK